MFYCKNCGKDRGWPIDHLVPKSRGPCELCGQHAVCCDVPSKHLPLPSPEMTEEPEPEPVKEGVADIRSQWQYREDAEEGHLYEPEPFDDSTMHRHIGILLREFDMIVKRYQEASGHAASKEKEVDHYHASNIAHQSRQDRLVKVLEDANRVIIRVKESIEQGDGLAMASLCGYRLRHPEFFFPEAHGCVTCLHGDTEFTGGVCGDDNPETGGGELSEEGGYDCLYWRPWFKRIPEKSGD